MKTLQINGLFGHNSVTIDISNRCLVLIGENGAGKSTILKIIKALSELDFIELSKYRFDSIEYTDDTSSFKIELSDIMPNGIVDIDVEEIDQSDLISIENPEYHLSFEEEFYLDFIGKCRKQISSNHLAWILSCINHGKKLDRSDIKLLDIAKVYAYERCASNTIYDQSFQYLNQIDIIEIINKEVIATEFSTESHGLGGELNFDIKLFKNSNLYYGKFHLQSKTIEHNRNENVTSNDDLYVMLGVLPNIRFLEIVKKIMKIKSLMNLGSCLLVDMTSQFDLVNNQCHEPSVEDIVSLFYLRNMSASASLLGVNTFNPQNNVFDNEMRKLHIRIYTECIQGLLRSYNKNDDNEGDYDHLNLGLLSHLDNIYNKKFFLDQLIENNQINISELISRKFFSNNTKIEINVLLFKKYIKALNENQIYTVDKNHEMFPKLSSFFFDKCEELKDWCMPIILRNSVFDFKYDELYYTSKEIDEIENEWYEHTKEYRDSPGIQLSKKPSTFNFVHVIFYEFYNNEFNKYKKKFTNIVNKFTKVLSMFIFNKKISIAPSGIRIENQSGIEIEPQYLSSGEKKILVLIMISMFINDVTLLLDEPEISISVIWQSILLPTLLNRTSIDRIFVATQSPFVIEDEDMMKYLQALN